MLCPDLYQNILLSYTSSNMIARNSMQDQAALASLRPVRVGSAAVVPAAPVGGMPPLPGKFIPPAMSPGMPAIWPWPAGPMLPMPPGPELAPSPAQQSSLLNPLLCAPDSLSFRSI